MSRMKYRRIKVPDRELAKTTVVLSRKYLVAIRTAWLSAEFMQATGKEDAFKVELEPPGHVDVWDPEKKSVERLYFSREEDNDPDWLAFLMQMKMLAINSSLQNKTGCMDRFKRLLNKFMIGDPCCPECLDRNITVENRHRFWCPTCGRTYHRPEGEDWQ